MLKLHKRVEPVPRILTHISLLKRLVLYYFDLESKVFVMYVLLVIQYSN